MSANQALRLLASSILVIAALACGTAQQDLEDVDLDEQDTEVGEVGVTDQELLDMLDALDVKLVSIVREKNGISASIWGPQTLTVGQSGTYDLQIWNRSSHYIAERPFDITFDSAEVLSSGPVTVGKIGNWNEKPLAPGHGAGVWIIVTCDAAGPAVITGQVEGQSRETNPPSGYSISVDYPLECIDKSEATSAASDHATSDDTVAILKSGNIGIPVSATGINTSEGGCDELSWSPITVPLPGLILSDLNEVDGIGEYDDSGDECGVGRASEIDIFLIDIHSEDWASYCDTAEAGYQLGWAIAECRDVLGLDWDPDPGDIEGGADEGGGEIVDSASPTPVTIANGWRDLQANRNTTGDTINLGASPGLVLGTGEGELPYWDVQFRIEQPHAGCDVEHVHADQTVYAFTEWARGGLSGWKSNEAYPTTDPDPDGCGFGPEDALNGKPVAIDGAAFLDFCATLEEQGLLTSNLKRQCQIKIDAIIAP